MSIQSDHHLRARRAALVLHVRRILDDAPKRGKPWISRKEMNVIDRKTRTRITQLRAAADVLLAIDAESGSNSRYSETRRALNAAARELENKANAKHGGEKRGG